MSLIISVYVPAGIVISGDSRVIGTLLQQVPQPTERNPEAAITVQTQIKISDFASKIFLVYDKYGVGTFGDAIINNIPIAHHISLFQAQNSNIPQSVEHLAQALLQYFSASSPIPNVGFIVAGYKGIIPWVFGVNPQAQSIERVNITGETSQLNYGIVRGGDTAIVDRLLSQAQFNPLFDVMNLQDAVDYSRHLIRLTTEQMRFEPRVATVGGEIDTLILTPNEAKFLYCKELHCS